MAYIPENKYQVLHTDGSEYKIASNNKPYVGKYLKLDNGKLFAGEHPNNIIGALTLIKNIRPKNIKPGINNDIYSILKPQIAEEQGNYIPIPPHTPTPSALDYSRGYFTRYLSVRLNTKQYKEISKTTFQNFNQKTYNKTNNKVFQIEWDLNENNEALNTKSLTKLNYQLPGISNYFPNKSQFGLKRGIINISPTSRIYPTGDVIPKILPAAYQIGNEQINAINNPEVPEFQYCGNCGFNKNGYCNKWKANIRSNYWCRSYINNAIYKFKENEEPPSMEQPPSPPPPPPTTTSIEEDTPTTPTTPSDSPPPTSMASSGGGGGY